MFNESVAPGSAPDNIGPARGEHTPEGLIMQSRHAPGHVCDERGFLVFDPSVDDPNYFERRLAQQYKSDPVIFDLSKDSDVSNRKAVTGLIQTLGRLPTPAEVAREQFRLRLIRQVGQDLGFNRPNYYQAEEKPQRAVIEKRKNNFPAEAGLKEFEYGEAHIEEDKGGVKRLIITTRDRLGKTFDHPVMTTEEQEDWVRPSAEMIARSLGEKKKDAKVFIAGLGLGLLNEELRQLGVNHHVVAELNHQVIELVGEPLRKKYSDLDLDIRQGDFKAVLRAAVEQGELFDAISIDAFPNSAEEVNRDASSDEVLRLAYEALKPGGTLTFYPDSRYIPARILWALHDLGVPDSAIHYTIGRFQASEFTRGYHYGDLMSIPCIKKPLLTDPKEIADFRREYNDVLKSQLQAYVNKHLHN